MAEHVRWWRDSLLPFWPGIGRAQRCLDGLVPLILILPLANQKYEWNFMNNFMRHINIYTVYMPTEKRVHPLNWLNPLLFLIHLNSSPYECLFWTALPGCFWVSSPRRSKWPGGQWKMMAWNNDFSKQKSLRKSRPQHPFQSILGAYSWPFLTFWPLFWADLGSLERRWNFWYGQKFHSENLEVQPDLAICTNNWSTRAKSQWIKMRHLNTFNV